MAAKSSADPSIEAIRKSGGRLNEWGIKEMLDYLRRIGYAPDDLNRLNVVHVTGTKGKGSTSAFAERILRDQLGGKIGASHFLSNPLPLLLDYSPTLCVDEAAPDFLAGQADAQACTRRRTCAPYASASA